MEKPLIFSITCSCCLIFLSLGLSIAADILTPTGSVGEGGSLVSASQSFVLGFFSRGNSKNRYLGVWYQKSPETVVWIANRNKPITDQGTLKVDETGNLVLLDQGQKLLWSTNVSGVTEQPVAQLLDTGNLVLKYNNSNGSQSYLWQSFDDPSDTLLPGMKLGRNPETGFYQNLTSWTSADDPSPGDYSYTLETQRGLPQLVIDKGSVTMYRSGPWKEVRLGDVPAAPSLAFKPFLVYNEDEQYYTFEAFGNSAFLRLTLSETGVVEFLALNASNGVWDKLYSAPSDMCDTYQQCGTNSICNTSKAPVCECLKGFEPKLKEEQGTENQSMSRKCEREAPLDCQSRRFLRISGVKFPALNKFGLNKSMSLKECEAECLKTCSCNAYANLNASEGGSDCLMWSGDLIDIRQVSKEQGGDIYIRSPASESESTQDGNKKNRLKTILPVSIVSGITILGLICCIIWRRTKRKGLQQWNEEIEVPLFDFSTINSATNNFSEANLIGEGGFGPVYKGDLPTGQEFAVKRLSRSSGQGIEEFRNEILLIAKLQHRNLVSLLGSCMEGEERMLIYEFMPNKSLDNFIFDQSRKKLLPWQKRFKIVLGIARGLLYLHQDSKLQVIHRDLKASNVLLDSNLNPKISDFGLARKFKGNDEENETQRIIGTYGYMSPEYVRDGTFSAKSDVFSFGVLLLEIVSGQRNRKFYHPAHGHHLLGHAWLLWNDDKALELMDPCLEESCVVSEMQRCIQVGLLCVQESPKDRPFMSSVLLMLTNDRAILPQPKQPGFYYMERNSNHTTATSNKENSSTENAVTITILDAR